MPKLPAYPLYLVLAFLTSLFFSLIFVVTSFYEVTVAGLSGMQLVLVGTTLEVVILLFEVPTGIVADAHSRKLSLVIGYLIMGLGFIIEGLFPYFAAILLASGMWGLGHTFTSGAQQAWLSDEIGEEAANRAFLRANRFHLAGAFVGMLLAIPLGNLSVALPILAGGAGLMLFAVLLALFMPETRFAPARPENRNTFQHMSDIFKKGFATVRARPALTAVLGVGFIYGLYSEGWDRLWVKYLVDTFPLPSLFGMNEVAFFGIMRAVGMLLSIVVTQQVEKRLDSSHAPSIARGMSWLTGLLALAIFTFAFAPTLGNVSSVGVAPMLGVAVAAVLLVSITRNILGPLYIAWVNQRLDSDTRATILSMSGQVDAIGQIASGPLAGVVSLWSVQAAIAFASLLLTPALPLIRRANRLHGSDVL
jgi:DHA3 family tetracycline resistance protein-like MFS transporter